MSERPARALLLTAAFALHRLLVVLCGADRIAEPDLAETKLMALGDGIVSSGWPGLQALLDTARAGANAPHGAFLPVSLAYAALVVPLGAAGSYLALKVVGIAVQSVGFLGATEAVGRLAGPRARWLAAAALLLAPPAFLGPSLVVWGSHPEATALLLGALFAVFAPSPVRARGAALAGVALGLAAGADLLVAPLAGLFLAGALWDGWTTGPTANPAPRLAAALGGFALPLVAALAIGGAAGASVVEDAGSSPLELLGATDDPDGLVAQTLAELLPPPLFGGDGRAAELVLGVLWLASALLVASRLPGRAAIQGRVTALLLAPGLHLVLLALLAPRRPFIPPRYVLPALGLMLLVPPLAAAWSFADRRPALLRAAAAVSALAWLLPGLAAQPRLLDPRRAGGFFAYHPDRYVAADIGHVDYARAPGVNAFLEYAGPDPRGFGLAAGVSAAEDLLLSGPPPHLVDAAELLGRRAEARAATEADALETLDRNLGWGLAVFAPDRPGLWLSVLERMDEGRSALAQGVGRGLGESGAAGCEALRRVIGPDSDAILEGARGAGDRLQPRCRVAAP